MAWTTQHGPPGLEGTHTWGGVVLNTDRSLGLPRYKLDRITGLMSLPEAQDFRQPRTGRRGEESYPGAALGKTVVYEGRIQAPTLQDMRLMETELRGAFRKRGREQVMALARPSGPGWFYGATVAQLDIDDEQTRGPSAQPTPWQRGFLIGLRLGEPRIFMVTPQSYGPFVHNTWHQVTNLGNTDADPTFTGTVLADGTDVSVYNSTVQVDGAAARLTFRDLPAGAFACNFNQRTTTVDGEDVAGKLDPDYDRWWNELVPGIEPGANQLRAVGLSAWGVTFFHSSE
jgi:hypothetical protein